jgi:hypothetical protein
MYLTTNKSLSTCTCNGCNNLGAMAMVSNATFNDISVISWWSVLLVEETGIPGEIHRPTASH